MHYNCRLQIYIIKVKNFSASLADIITSCCFFVIFSYVLLFTVISYFLLLPPYSTNSEYIFEEMDNLDAQR